MSLRQRVDLLEAQSSSGHGAQAADETIALEAKGWRAWYAAIFGQDFVDVWAEHHEEAIAWHWNARMAQRRGEQPDYNSYFPIWSREHMKSSVARRIAVCDACLATSPSVPAAEREGFCLYLSRNKDMVLGHASSIETLLTSDAVKNHYPLLSQVKKTQAGNSKGWRAAFIHTNAGYIFKFAGLDEGLAGGNIDDVRPTLIVPDDIDGRDDSATISDSRLNKLTTEVLPMAESRTLVFFPQNLISRFSTMYRIFKGQVRVLTDRKPTQPVPAFRNFKTETQTVDGIVRDVIVSGEPTWKYFDKEKAQARLNRDGLKSFLRERQHEVEQSDEGLVIQNYDDGVHVITESQFAAVFGTREMPQHWNKHILHDWARTKTASHANVALTVAVASQNSPLPGRMFIFNPMSFPAGTEPDDVALRLLNSLTPAITTEHGERLTWVQLIRDALTRENLERHISDTTKLLDARRNVMARVIPKYTKGVLRAQTVAQLRMSHEAKGARDVYAKAFGLVFQPINPGADGGVDWINRYFAVDYHAPHPFDAAREGNSQMFVVVPDAKAKLNEALTPEELHDYDLLRFQLMNCRFRDPQVTASGMTEYGILKMNDDFVNALMMGFHDNSIQAARLTHDEQIDAVTPECSRYETLKAASPHEHGLTAGQELQFFLARQEAKKKIKPRYQYFGDDDD